MAEGFDLATKVATKVTTKAVQHTAKKGIEDLIPGVNNNITFVTSVSETSVNSILITNAIAATISLLLFQWVKEWNKKVFRSRRSDTPFRNPNQFPKYYTTTTNKSGFWKKFWICESLSHHDSDVAAISGVQAVTYLRLESMLVGFLTFIGVMNIVVLIPVYVCAPRDEKAVLKTWWSQTSVTAVKAGSNYLWAPMVLFGFSCLVFFKVYSNFYTSYLDLRQALLKKPTISSYTVMVSRIPESYRTRSYLIDKLLLAFPHMTRVAFTPPKAGKLCSEKCDYEKLVEKTSRAKNEAKKTKRELKLAEKKQEIVNLADGHYDNNAPVGSVCFVSFSDMSTAAIASQSLLNLDSSTPSVRMAPEPNDLLWKYFDRQNALVTRKLIFVIIILSIFIFWTVPVTFFNQLMATEAIKRLFSGSLAHFVQGYLSSGLLVLLMDILIPLAFVQLSKIMVPLSKSRLASLAAHQYFYFLLIEMLVVQVAASVIVEFIRSLYDHNVHFTFSLDNPTIAKSLISNAYSFYCFALQRVLGECAFFIITTTDWQLTYLLRRPLRKIDSMAFFKKMSLTVHTFLLVSLYGFMIPLMMPVCCFGFFLVYCLHKDRFLYYHAPVCRPEPQYDLTINALQWLLVGWSLICIFLGMFFAFHYHPQVAWLFGGYLFFTIVYSLAMLKAHGPATENTALLYESTPSACAIAKACWQEDLPIEDDDVAMNSAYEHPLFTVKGVFSDSNEV